MKLLKATFLFAAGSVFATPDFHKDIAPILREFANQRRIGGEIYRGDWTDVGTVERLEQLNAPLNYKN